MSKKRKNAPKKEPLKAAYVEPRPRPCSRELLEEHLAAFINAFVMPERRERARLMLLEKPERRPQAISELHTWLDARFVEDLEGQETFAQVLAKIHGNPSGVFLSCKQVCLLHLDEAVSESTFGFEDAIFSITPGQFAFWFDHHGAVLRCKR